MRRAAPGMAARGMRIPEVALGLVGSLAAHAALIATLTLMPYDRSPDTDFVAPTVEYARGEPIKIRIVSDRDSEHQEINEQPSPEPIAVASKSVPTTRAMREPSLRKTVVPSDAEAPPETDTLAKRQEAAPPPRSPIDWSELAASLLSIDWTSALESADTRGVASETTPPESEQHVAPEGGSEESSDARVTETREMDDRRQNEPSGHDAPRGLDRGAAVIEVPQPVYPRRSIRLKQEGTAVVEVLLRADGGVRQVRLRSSSGYKRLDEAALEAARNGRFSPALENDQAIESVLVLPFEFNLRTSR